MKFIKMQGLGNDYVYVDCFREEIKNPEQAARFVSDRHFGIGSDGLILIRPSSTADCRMDMYNADGSRGMMCGNGIRCVGKYVYDHGIVDKETITVDTLAGIKTLELEITDGKVSSVTVDMGLPKLLAPDGEVWEDIQVAGERFRLIPISMGNPHAVLFMDDIDSLDLEKLGPLFEHHERFPDRTNTEFAELVDDHKVRMRVWERGSGETLACGTGACAVAVASAVAGHTGRNVDVELRGGVLNISWDEQTGRVMMKGPANEVFKGEIDIE